MTPEFYTGRFARGGFTNPDPAVRRQAIDLVAASAEVGRELGVEYVKIWPGQDGYDYPFQADYTDLWAKSVEALRELAQSFPDVNFAIEYKPREPRNRMVFSSVARTLLAIEDMGVDNVGVLLDFGHSLYGGETPRRPPGWRSPARSSSPSTSTTTSAAGTTTWSSDPSTFSRRSSSSSPCTTPGGTGCGSWTSSPSARTPSRPRAPAIRTMRAFHHALGYLDRDALATAQASQDALGAQRIAKRALFRALAESESESA